MEKLHVVLYVLIEQAHGIFKQIDIAHKAGNSVDILGKYIDVVDCH